MVVSIKNGVVIDHVTPGKGMGIHKLLGLGELEGMVALINNAASEKMGRKDIIKNDAPIELDMDVLGYVDPGVTVSVIRDGKTVDKKKMSLPMELEGVLRCRNPRCICSTEQELVHTFKLVNPAKREYRCIYCETKV